MISHKLKITIPFKLLQLMLLLPPAKIMPRPLQVLGAFSQDYVPNNIMQAQVSNNMMPQTSLSCT